MDSTEEQYFIATDEDEQVIESLVEEFMDIFEANFDGAGANVTIAAAISFGKTIEREFTAKLH